MLETNSPVAPVDSHEPDDFVPAEFIRARAEKVIAGVLRDEVGFARAVKAMVAHTIKEYRGRFLHELIQNGYDAHLPGTRDGKVAIIFDETEGAHGVLYVANGGRPLSQSNFERMATLGESDKPIGEGIGNKGVGFKSVFQICDVPEIYSARDSRDPMFNGFSFRLGTRADLLEMLDDDDIRADQVEKNLSLSMLTVPLSTVPRRAQALREQGYVTVLRLPCSSPRAAQEVEERIGRLLNSPAPIMLFLDRLSSMTIQSSNQSDCEVLVRNEIPAEFFGKRVILNDSIRFHMFSLMVPQERLLAALQESVDEGALDARWLEWDASAEVSVAVGDGWEVSAPHAFTYLPMGDNTAAPFSGHINAPFVTDFARLGLDPEQPVNKLLLEFAAELCIRSAEQLIAANLDANSVVDLTTWAVNALSFVDEASKRLNDRPLADVIRVPCLGSGWAALSSVHRWPTDSGNVITPESIARVTAAHLVDPSRLSETRLGRLAETGKHLGSSLEPAPEVLAEWVERLAADLGSNATTMTKWRLFYDDLPDLFASGDPLSGRNLLLSADGAVVSCDHRPKGNESPRRHGIRAVFFSPKSTGTDDDDAVDSDLDFLPPKSLEDRLVFLHPELEWYVGTQRTRGRAFLQDRGLARQFRTAGLLLHLGQVMAGKTSPRVKSDALQFAFRLFANNPTKHSKELAAVGLEVPTIEGRWIKAGSARFSAGWQVEGADDLSTLAAVPNDTFPELSRLSTVLLAEPMKLDGTGTQPERWRDFLQVIGVAASLPVMEHSDQRAFKGRNLTRAHIATSSVPAEVPHAVVAQWLPALPDSGNVHHPDTRFTTADPICWFIGQHESSALPLRAKEAYARSVARTLPTLSEEQRHSTWKRQNPGGWASKIPTPLTAFLTSEKWMPVAKPRSDQMEFASPDEVWFVKQEDLMAASYSPVLHAAMRKILTAISGFTAERLRLGLRLWGDAGDAAKLIDHLTGLLDAGDVPDTALEHFRSALALAWAQVGDAANKSVPHLNHGVPVDRAGHMLVARDVDAESDPLFIAALEDKSTTTRLIREIGWPTVDVESTQAVVLEGVANLLSDKWPANVQVASGWKLDVLIDGTPWRPAKDSHRLIDEVPWLPLLVACTMRHPRASALRAGKQISKTLDDLSRIRLGGCQSITIATAAGHQRLPQRLRGVLPMPGTAPTLLAEGLSSPLTWPHLEVLAEAALELLGQSRFSAELSLNLRKLNGDSTDTFSKPENWEIADALGTPSRLIDETEAYVLGSVSGIVGRLSHVAPCLWDEETWTVIHPDNVDLLSMDGLRAAVTAACSGDTRAAAELLDAAADTATSDELRRRLGINVKVFNTALARYFPDAPAVDYTERFAHEFSLRKSVRRKELIHRARTSRLQDFRGQRQQTDWHSIRDLTFLTADPEWGTSIDELTSEQADQQIDKMMTVRFGQELHFPDLPSWDKIREINGKPMLERLEVISRAVRAWCVREEVRLIPLWAESTAPELVWARLDSVGALDFEELDDATLISWLGELALWPVDMEQTLDLNRLGISANDLSAQESAAAVERQARLRQQRQVTLHGQVIDLDDSMSTLVTNMRELLQSNPQSLRTPYRTSALRPATPSRAGNNRTSSPGSSRQAAQRMSDIQRNALGLAGEMIAYYWLLERDPGYVDELCWKSRNCSLALGGRTGDDGLGYDFEVPRAEGTVMYEVKATQGEAGMIELGETEVRCAQEHARSDRWRLLIVEEVLSDSPRIMMLPNPFRADSRSMYSFVGNSVRLRFALHL